MSESESLSTNFGSFSVVPMKTLHHHSRSRENLSGDDERDVSEGVADKVILSKGVGAEQSFELQRSDFGGDGDGAETEDSVLMTANSTNSKYEFSSGENVIHFVEKPKGVKVSVHEMFFGINEDLSSDFEKEFRSLKESEEILVGGNLDEDEDSSDVFLECEGSLEEQELESDLEESDRESGSPSCSFRRFDSGSFRNEESNHVDRGSLTNDRGRVSQPSSIVAWNWDSFSLNGEDHSTLGREGIHHGEDGNSLESLSTRSDEHAIESVDGEVLEDQDVSFSYEEDHSTLERVDFHHGKDGTSLESLSTKFDEHAIESVDGEVLEDQDVSYEVELLSPGRYLELDGAEQDILTNSRKWGSSNQDGVDFHDTSDKRESGGSNIDHIRSKSIEDLDDEYIELEPSLVRSRDLGQEGSRNYTMNEESADNEGNVSVEGSEEKPAYFSDSDEEDESGDDALREHQNLVHQMKMELKACRIRGLPTISEEFETPKMVEDLRPLHIDHKCDYKDKMADIQNFCKSYTEKMRKLDILNYQTLQAISVLQLKESEVFTAGRKKSASDSFNMSKIWSYKVQKVYADPMQKSIKEMQHDLELVYVGQLCISWEILSWMCIKGQELMEYDTGEHHSYNRAAGEFQQFQVLLHRFIEDEQFQGPRVQNYVKNRCMIRTLLHVPMIKDDCLKDKKETKEENGAISLATLLEIIRESMLVLRDFIRADKASANVILKGLQGTKVAQLDTANSELLLEIVTSLQKKERKLGEQTRSQNCLIRKFQKHQEMQLSHEISAAQVELRLVSRVLSLSRLTTDQLLWCRNKLSNISFVRRKVHLEPSFLLFPC